MKYKLSALLMALIMTLGFSFCSDDDDDCDLAGGDEDEIRDVINGMAVALNAENLNNFLDYFHEDCDYQDSFTSGDLTALHGSGDYSFSSFSIDGDCKNADVDCSATVGVVPGYDTDFEMKKSDGDWYIFRWYEEGSTIFRRVR